MLAIFVGLAGVINCPPTNFSTQFERSGDFNLSSFIGAR